MKRLLTLILILIMGSSFLIAQNELDLLNLKGINDVIFFISINGVSYRRGYSHIRERRIKDFNLEKVEERLSTDKIPFKGQFIKQLYKSGISQLEKVNIRIKEIYDGELTIVPILTLTLDIKRATDDLFVILVNLMLSERIWIRPGKEKKTTVYIWFKKKIGMAKVRDLKSSLLKIVDQVMTDFTVDYKNVNSKK